MAPKMTILVAAVSCLLALSCVHAARPRRFEGSDLLTTGLQAESNWTQQVAATGTVNLDLAPEDRWKDVCGSLRNECPKGLGGVIGGSSTAVAVSLLHNALPSGLVR